MNRHCSTAAWAGAAPIKRPSKTGTRIFNGVGPLLPISSTRRNGSNSRLCVSAYGQACSINKRTSQIESGKERAFAEAFPAFPLGYWLFRPPRLDPARSEIAQRRRSQDGG